MSQKTKNNSAKLGTVIIDELNVNVATNFSSKVLGTIKKGTIVEIIRHMPNNWLKIKWNSSPKGYAFISNKDKRNIQFIQDTPIQVIRKMIDKNKPIQKKPVIAMEYTAEIVSDSIIYKGPGTQYLNIGVAHKGETYKVFETQNSEWVKLQGRNGYIIIEDIKKKG